MSPVYEYECTNKDCNHVQERVFTMSKKKDSVKCEKCGKKAKFIFGAPNVIVPEGEGDFFTKDAKY